MEELPDGSWLVTENPGRMHLVRSGEFSAWITGLPEVDAERQGGLLDVCVAADFDATCRVMWNYAEPSEGGTNGTLGATGVLSPDGSAMEGVEVIFRKMPGWASTAHCGSRLVFGADGALFVTPGEGSQPEPRQLPQDVSTHFGKVLRHTSIGRRAAPGDPNIERALPKLGPTAPQRPVCGAGAGWSTLGNQTRRTRRRQAQPHRGPRQLGLAGPHRRRGVQRLYDRRWDHSARGDHPIPLLLRPGHRPEWHGLLRRRSLSLRAASSSEARHLFDSSSMGDGTAARHDICRIRAASAISASHRMGRG